jgi:DNA-binding transcriptional LysR family regulator
VTGAARELNYAQPSISHHLARLEAETGTKLIQRAGRGIRLTDAGRLLADRAAEVLGRLDAAENELAAHAGLRRGRVRLAAFPSALGTIVPVAAARLQAEHPGLEITLTEAEPPEALRMLRAGYVDVALVFRHEHGPEGAADDAAGAPRSRLLLEEPVFLVTPSRGRAVPAGDPDPGTSGAGPDLAAYASERWIAGCERCRRHLLQQCARAGFTPNIAFTTDDYIAVQALVAAGLGITTLPGLALRAARHEGVDAQPLAGARRYVFAMTYGAPPDPPPTARLLDALTATASATGEPRDEGPRTDERRTDEGRTDEGRTDERRTAVPAPSAQGAATSGSAPGTGGSTAATPSAVGAGLAT